MNDPIASPSGRTTPGGRPVMVFDGDCGFCRRWIERWRRITGERVAYEPYQRAAPTYPEITVEQFARSVHLIEPGGRVTRGAEAVFRSLAVGGRRRWLAAYERVPGFAPLSELAYRFVASHRQAFSRLTRWLG